MKTHELKTQPFKIAIITSRFNEPVTEKLTASALARLKELGFPEEDITEITVPGAVEIPIVAQALAKKSQHKAIVCLGCVIRGETSHYDYVCQQVSQGCQQISLEHHLPVIFGILTTENAEQAFARAGGVHSDKGKEAIDTALEMVELLDILNS